MISNSSLVALRNPDVTSLAARTPKNLFSAKAVWWPSCLASLKLITGVRPLPGSIPTIFTSRSIACGKLRRGGSAGEFAVIYRRILLRWNSLGSLRSQFYNGRKKAPQLQHLKFPVIDQRDPSEPIIEIQQAAEAAVDDMWSLVGKKAQPRWLWPALDHRTGVVFA